jgi:hypothetical protein
MGDLHEGETVNPCSTYGDSVDVTNVMITAGVRSADGAMISYHQMGSGPPLVIVPAS